MRHLHLVLAVLPTLSALPGQDLGGEHMASNNLFPRLTLSPWIPGTNATASFLNLPASTVARALVISPTRSSKPQPGINGTMTADVFAPGAILAFVPPTFTAKLPTSIAGRRIYVQGIIADNTGLFFSTGLGCDLFDPMTLEVPSEASRE